MNDIVIKANNIGKRYVIGRAPGAATLTENVANVMLHPVKTARKIVHRNPAPSMWALKDVSFDVKQGEIIGIIGRNGSGKSTLLKILARITEPTTGYAELRGRLSALLEVGTGFHPELTGRENIFLNGTVLGMKRPEIARKFDEIVDFADIGEFLDTPVKRYSSGMYVRLAFAVAAHLEPDILVIDEVLAVGDAEFQRKCLGKMGKVADLGRTVIFVSHNMAAVESLCPRAIWLNKGHLMADGSSSDVVRDYLASAGESAEAGEGEIVASSPELTIERFVIKDSNGRPASALGPGEPIRVEIHYNAAVKLIKPHFSIAIAGRHGWLFGSNMVLDGFEIESLEGKGMIACDFAGVRLLPGIYRANLSATQRDGLTNYFERDPEVSFSVTGSAAEHGLKGERAHHQIDNVGSILVPYTWQFPNGKIGEVKFENDSGAQLVPR